MINSIGLPNKGLEGFLAEDLPQLAELPVPLIVSVMATNREEFSRLVGAVAAREEVAAIELNVSCPNVHSGLIVGEQPTETEALLEALRPLTAKPLIVKLTPNVADPAAVAVGRRAGGRRRGLADQHPEGQRDRPRHAASRPWPPATAASRARRCARSPCSSCARSPPRSALPAIGMGGISSGADAAEFLAAGASSGGGRDREFPRPAGGLAGRRGARRRPRRAAPRPRRYSTSSRG